jgi:hypothetical protein
MYAAFLRERTDLDQKTPVLHHLAIEFKCMLCSIYHSDQLHWYITWQSKGSAGQWATESPIQICGSWIWRLITHTQIIIPKNCFPAQPCWKVVNEEFVCSWCSKTSTRARWPCSIEISNRTYRTIEHCKHWIMALVPSDGDTNAETLFVCCGFCITCARLLWQSPDWRQYCLVRCTKLALRSKFWWNSSFIFN